MMTLTRPESNPEPDMDASTGWTIEVFQDDDAPGVTALYRAIYGEHFPLVDVYNAEWHIQQAHNRDSLRVVARLSDGSIAATGALFRSVPSNPDLYEGGGLLVLDEYRTHNLPVHIMGWLSEHLPRMYNIDRIWGEAVCNHLVTQQLTFKSGHIPCALEVEAMPASAYEKLSERGQNIQGRVSTMVMYKELRKREHRLFLPTNYKEALADICGSLGFPRTLQTARPEVPKESTRGQAASYSGSGLLRMTVQQVGQDFRHWLKQTEPAGIEDQTMIWQIIIPLNHSSVDYAVQILNEEGYWLGGLMPGWFGHDGLLMQKMTQTPDFDKIRVYSKPGKAIFNMVRSDCREKGRQR